MDVNSGHLVSDLSSLREEDRPKYTPVPANLSRAAARKLGKDKEATVSLTSGGKLSRWAAELRKWQVGKPEGKAAARRRRQLANASDRADG